jgi:hypothetical protein
MKNYGLTEFQIKQAHDKLKFNKEFMQSNGIQLDDKIIPFADFVANSYMNSDRYIAELQHRAWSIYEYAEEHNLKNIFFTLTLPSKWHKFKTINKKLVFNPKFGGRKYICIIEKIKFINAHVVQNIPFIEPILDFSETIDKYTPRNASKELSKMLKSLFNERSYRSIEKDDRCYFRVTEPHKNGTPHIHMSLFVPEDKKDSVVKSLTRLYPAPLGKIEVDIDSPVAYLMKYVLKTLDDLRGEKSITNLTLWYLYHGISRFYTSRTFVTLEAYRKLNGMYSLRYLTKDYLREDVSIFIDSETNKIKQISNEFGIIYTAKPVNWYDNLVDTDHTYLEVDFESMYQEKETRPIEIIIDGEEFMYYKGDVKKQHMQPYMMNDFELYQYFQKLDIETENEQHYIYTHNLLVERGYLNEELLSMTAFQDIIKEFETVGEF